MAEVKTKWCDGGSKETRCSAHNQVQAHQFIMVVMNIEVPYNCPGGSAAIRCGHGKIEGHSYQE